MGLVSFIILVVQIPGERGPLAYKRGGDPGRLVVSLRGVNFRFWSHLGWSGPLCLAVKVSFRVACEEI